MKKSSGIARLADINARALQLSFETLAALSVGIFVVRTDGRVRLMNRAAERVVKGGIVCKVRNGYLSLSDRGLNSRLRTAIRRATLMPMGGSLSSHDTIMMRTTAGESLSLIVVSLPSDLVPAGPSEPLAAVLTNEPLEDLKLSPDLVRAKYGLTAAEARVLLAILEGKNLAGHAADAGVSINTINTQMKALFAKTGCHRQADLVAMVLGDPILRIAIE